MFTTNSLCLIVCPICDWRLFFEIFKSNLSSFALWKNSSFVILYGYINTVFGKHSENVLYYLFFSIIVYLYCRFRITILLWFFLLSSQNDKSENKRIYFKSQLVFWSLIDPKSGMSFTWNPVHIWSPPDVTCLMSEPNEVFSNKWFGQVLYMLLICRSPQRQGGQAASCWSPVGQCGFLFHMTTKSLVANVKANACTCVINP